MVKPQEQAVHGNLSHAMRDNYNEHGVDEVRAPNPLPANVQYYRKVATTYRNPFFLGVKKVGPPRSYGLRTGSVDVYEPLVGGGGKAGVWGAEQV
jgi:hypothetical protein